jgi:DNA-binding MarR family transcriptional regulator
MKSSTRAVPELATPGTAAWPWALGEPLEFLRLLWGVAHALHSTSKRLEVTMGITGPQRLALQMVGRFPQITAGQLARLLHVDPSTLTGIVQRLVRRGLVERRPDAHDGRRTLLGLTALGRRFELTTRRPGKGAGAESTEAAVARALNRLRPADVAAARRTLTALTEALGSGGGPRAGATGPASSARNAGKTPRASSPSARKPARRRLAATVHRPPPRSRAPGSSLAHS